jgi:hypothetical protein
MRRQGGQQQQPGSNSGLSLYEQSEAKPSLLFGLGAGAGSASGAGLATRLRETRFFLTVSPIS